MMAKIQNPWPAVGLAALWLGYALEHRHPGETGKRVRLAGHVLRGRPTIFKAHVDDGFLVLANHSMIVDTLIENSGGMRYDESPA